MVGLITVGAFVCAAACGALIRLGATIVGGGGGHTRIPVGTLTVNLVGSFCLGIVAGWSPPASTVVGVAGIGALTTFSTLTGEVVELWDHHRPTALTYAAGSVVGGIAMAWLGLRL